MTSKTHKVLYKNGDKIAWYPQDGPHSLFFSLGDNQIFHKIGRTVHLREYEEVQKSQRLIPKHLDVRTVSQLKETEQDLKVLWFSPVDPHKDDNSFYGNVNFVVDFVKFLSYCSQNLFNIYFVEVSDFRTCNATHFLFTRKKYEYLSKYNSKTFGGPWYTDPIGKHFWLRNVRRYDGKTNIKGHNLEFMLEFGENDATWLYNESKPIPVEHCEANAGKSHKCLLYGITKTCPTPYKKEQTKELLTPPKSLETDDKSIRKRPLSKNKEETPRSNGAKKAFSESMTPMSKIKRNLSERF
ncbi:uncharacterized protein [Palaemon carinicauda]|uniref:uncharacterized protein isoform X1 n=1 Tax=Palaemon carinicauda TaxID=392227 RepID=UPI0035B628B4